MPRCKLATDRPGCRGRRTPRLLGQLVSALAVAVAVVVPGPPGLFASTVPPTTSPPGSGWAVIQEPGAGGIAGLLRGVACAPSACVAVGTELVGGQSDALVELISLSAANPTVSPAEVVLPRGWSGASLSGIACVAARWCMAVGHGTFSGQLHPLVVTGWGSTWSVPASVSKLAAIVGSFEGVACTAIARCLTVGYLGQRHPWAASWSGDLWKASYTSVVTGELNGVSCAAANQCVAVGNYDVAGALGTLLVIQSATGWHQGAARTSGPGTAAAGLTSVSCPSNAPCLAVGEMGDNQPPVVLRQNAPTSPSLWAAAKWAQLPQPANPSGEPDTGLYGAWCWTTANCVAVGALASSDVTSGGVPNEPQGGVIEQVSSTRCSAFEPPSITGSQVGWYGTSSWPGGSVFLVVGQASWPLTGTTTTTAAGTAGQPVIVSGQLTIHQLWTKPC
ncbi:MAG TPA: hypothetical protein VME46_24265 [Acidimicrobiales bacterium]|nr:hypothetical protein [Acidimicrobiales bacterium]